MATLSTISAVAAGGAAGALLRYGINSVPSLAAFGNFPIHTFSINILGSFLMGILVVVLGEKFNVEPALRAGLIVGFLGAFTTFSTFELEIYELVGFRAFFMAGVYLVLSVAVGFLALGSGILIGRRF